MAKAKLFTVNDVVSTTGMARSTVYKYIQTGRIPATTTREGVIAVTASALRSFQRSAA
jgi:predicted site-specific integrase-resolvase